MSFTELNRTTFNISWSPLTREKSYGKVISYEVKAELLSSGRRRKRSPVNSETFNTSKAFVILHGIHHCYSISVRAYTKAGPGPFSQPLALEKSSESHLNSEMILILISLIQAFLIILRCGYSFSKHLREYFTVIKNDTQMNYFC